MFTTTTNATPILSTSVGGSSVAKHHRRLGFMGKMKRGLRDASLRPMYVSVSFFGLLAFSSFGMCWCMFLGFYFCS